MEKQKCSDVPIRTFVILDLETTGLYNKPRRITEIAVVAALREHILGFGNHINALALPRVLSKMCICVNPMKMISPGAIEVSGLSNEVLVSLNPFDEDLFNILESFIRRLPKPICIIAHNGIKFDFPILQNAVQKIGKAFPDHVLCADSYCAFRELFRKDNLKKMLKNEVPHTSTKDEASSSASKPPINKNENQNIKESIIGDDILTADKENTNIRNEQNQESEESELGADGYEDALYEALEAIEASPVYKRGDFEKLHMIDEVDASVIVTKTKTRFEIATSGIKSEISQNEKDMSPNYKKPTKSNIGHASELDETRSIQEAIEKTPKNSTSQRQRGRPKHSSNGYIQAPVEISTNGKRGGDAALNKVKKRLNFSPEKEEHIDVPKSLKLGDIYRFILKKEPMECHRAENDCLILLECIVQMQEHFLQWVDNNAIQLNTVKSEMSN